jgi:hypothetical protein
MRVQFLAVPFLLALTVAGQKKCPVLVCGDDADSALDDGQCFKAVPTQTGGKIDKIYMGKCNKDDPKYIENCDVKAGNYVWVNTALQMMDNP